MISITGAVWLVVYLIIGGIVFGLLNLLIDNAPFMPAEWKPIAKYLLLALAVLVIIGILISFLNGGGSPIFRP
jgi:hypothetical protein